MDGGPPIEAVAKYELFATPPGPLEREHIRVPLVTGIRAIDGLLPCGLGQRIGLFGGPSRRSQARNQTASDPTERATFGEIPPGRPSLQPPYQNGDTIS